jgi:hypothetical protein
MGLLLDEKAKEVQGQISSAQDQIYRLGESMKKSQNSIKVKDCIVNFCDTGVDVNGPYNVKFEDSRFADCGTGVSAQNGAEIEFEGYSFERVGKAIVSDQSSNITLGPSRQKAPTSKPESGPKKYFAGWRPESE